MSLCGITIYLLDKQSLPEYARNQKNRIQYECFSPKTIVHTHHAGKETHSCTCHRGSYTLEAAVILPLLAAFFAFILFFFRVLQVQTGVQEALIYAGRQTACEACAVDSQTVLFASAESYFQKELRQYPEIGNYVSGGGPGISLLQSDLSGSYVELQADYYIKLPFNFFSVDGIPIIQAYKSRKWIGDRADEVPEDYVYVTEHGNVYHCSRACHYLDLSIRAVNFGEIAGLRNKDDHKYYACSECVAKNKDLGMVYITDYGTCYHMNLSCCGLKRTIYMIPLSEVGGKSPCSKCGK